jgi:hypothetical protein
MKNEMPYRIASQLWPPLPGGHMSHVLPGVLCVLSAAGGWVTDLFEPRRRPSIISQDEGGGHPSETPLGTPSELFHGAGRTEGRSDFFEEKCYTMK